MNRICDRLNQLREQLYAGIKLNMVVNDGTLLLSNNYENMGVASICV